MMKNIFYSHANHVYLKRNAMDNAINCICPNFRQLSQNDKLIWLLNVENIDVLVSICELIKESDI